MNGSPEAALNRAVSNSVATSNTVGVGVDLVDIELVRSALESGGQHFLDASWTRAEQADAAKSVERLAARWAAKEAVMKAINHGIGEIDPLDIEIRKRPDGGPFVTLRKSAAKVAEARRIQTMHISMSHEQGWAVAFASAAGPPSYSDSSTNTKTEISTHV